jgi:hypothetical protein
MIYRRLCVRGGKKSYDVRYSSIAVDVVLVCLVLILFREDLIDVFDCLTDHIRRFGKRLRIFFDYELEVGIEELEFLPKENVFIELGDQTRRLKVCFRYRIVVGKNACDRAVLEHAELIGFSDILPEDFEKEIEEHRLFYAFYGLPRDVDGNEDDRERTAISLYFVEFHFDLIEYQFARKNAFRGNFAEQVDELDEYRMVTFLEYDRDRERWYDDEHEDDRRNLRLVHELVGYDDELKHVRYDEEYNELDWRAGLIVVLDRQNVFGSDENDTDERSDENDAPVNLEKRSNLNLGKDKNQEKDIRRNEADEYCNQVDCAELCRDN